MDQENLRAMRRICGGDPEGKIRLLKDYTSHQKGAPAKLGEAVSLGRGAAKKRSKFSPQAETETSGLCGDEVADLWYTGDFAVTWRDVSEGCASIPARRGTPMENLFAREYSLAFLCKY